MISASDDERRFLVLDVAAHQAQNKQYFEPLYSDTHEGEYCDHMLNDFYHLLRSIDTTQMDMTQPPVTKGLQGQKLASQTPLEQWWSSVIEDEAFIHYKHDPFTGANIKRPIYMDAPKKFVFDCYLSWIDKHKPNQSERITSNAQFGMAFRKLVSDKFIVTQNIKVRETGENGYRFKNPKEMIAHFSINL